MEQQQPHKRRKRYKGTHPRKFSEKYKELNPEKYQDDVKKIIGQGKTPAGMHISIMVQEILDRSAMMPHWDMADTRAACWSACTDRDTCTRRM